LDSSPKTRSSDSCDGTENGIVDLPEILCP
jgi:hypothetical protein